MNKLFFYLSKTDAKIINGNSRKAIYTQAAFGMFVLFTGVIAFFSGSYALLMAFGHSDNALIRAGIGGLLYSFIIMAFDREIVAAKDKRAILVRIPLALMIGVIVSIPLELSILEDRINEQLADEFSAKDSLNVNNRQIELNRLDLEEVEILKRLEIEKKDMKRWAKIMDEELAGRQVEGRTGKKGPGPVYRNAKNQYLTDSIRVAKIQAELDEYKDTKLNRMQLIQNNYKAEQPKKAYDLLSRYIALQRLKKSPDSEQAIATKLMSWGLSLLIIFIELFPALMKLFKEETDYDQIIEAQSQVNQGIIYTITDNILNDIEQNPGTFQKPDAIKLIQSKLDV